MSETRRVVCDRCGRDLTETGNCEGYRIVLMSEPIPSGGGAVTLMAVYPQIARPLHFCSVECLKSFVSENL